MRIKNCAHTSLAKPGGSKDHFFLPVALTALCHVSQIVHLGFWMGRLDSQIQMVHVAFQRVALAPRWSTLASGLDALAFRWSTLPSGWDALAPRRSTLAFGLDALAPR
jgi:hypothetical protein